MTRNSEQIRREWAIADKRQFCKQTCTKIDQGLAKLDNRSSERAIWELFQNARDLAKVNEAGKKESHIKIRLTSDEFIFAHQGRPFTHDSFSSLVKQVSAQEKENEDSVGQYGTGFLTTHAFGRVIKVVGSLDMENAAPGKFVNIDNFVIDRTYQDIPDFVNKMADQLLNIDCYADAEMVDDCRDWTELHYQLNSAEGAEMNAQKGIHAAINILPYVMTINSPIVDVTIVNEVDGRTISFSKRELPEENSLSVMAIDINDNGNIYCKKIYYLQSEDGQDIVVLPLKDSTTGESLSGIAKLFVCFPLLGTEDFGMDFIYHSRRFFPVEERDAIYLPVENTNVRSKYEQNVKVLNEMSDMLFDYLREHVEDISNWVDITTLSFECERNKEDVTNEFFCSFKEKWVEFLESLPIIPVDGERKSLCSDSFYLLSKEIVDTIENENGAEFEVISTVASERFNVPNTSDIIEWSKVVLSWKDADDSIFLSVEDIASDVSENGLKELDLLKQFDVAIKDMGYDRLFEKYTLIPNKEGTLFKKSDLRNAKDIPNWLYNIVKRIIPNRTSTFVNNEFSGIIEMTSFSRNDLKESINDFLSTQRKENLEKGNCYSDEVLNVLASICSVYKSEQGTTIRKNVMPLICKHLNVDYTPQILAPLSSDERDITELPFKHLVENMLLEISLMDSENVQENYEYILNLHQNLSSWSSYYDSNNAKGYAIEYGAFPNQLYIPCKASDLKVATDISDEKLVSLYNNIFNIDIKDELVCEDFNSFCTFEQIDSKTIAKCIEDELAANKFDNEYLLDIINELENKQWQEWFPVINGKKAELFMNQVKPACKDEVFRLMKIEDPNKLKQLADLADELDLDEILRRGREAVIAEHNKVADFEFKKSLGKYVEEFIQKELISQLNLEKSDIKVSVEDEQGGQDLVVYKEGEPVYYMEIKSRWGTDQSVMMSPLQMQRSVQQTSNYTLCCVDMTGFNISDCEKHIYPPIEDVLCRIKSLTNIGELNSVLIDGAFPQNQSDTVHIGGDFKCIVPQKVIQNQGKSFELLLDTIISHCK